ncbi:ankyrin repeat domain-containing protein 27-like [Gigantopelta aegis]|uniref:ankyrin repeat domain-containing protein 27-like n=1 Tax=Gigantopelta aegis TaxID=1735272 RepID=UPI001B88DD13|nr:ankyrin repeat domain-containing protein 27-like [Gigantopelta aegis]XP_041376516.1 ankyrin repeat domain-containing protein 27-like [Gigantopelta aegis]XP_041376518.1 ankyrin repeat domain-containing protein 27-like [Gigantopelta aegis]
MSAQYDEDIYDNPFFVALQTQFGDILKKAAQNGWIVCVPQFRVASGYKVTSNDAEDHVLMPKQSSKEDGQSDEMDTFQSLSAKEVGFVGGKLKTGKGFEIQQQVTILFEETFCDDNDESYRVICLEHFLNAPPGPEVKEETQPTLHVMNYEQCLDLLWNHPGGLKTRDNVDKVLGTFSASYDGLEAEGLRALVDVATTQFTKIMQILLKDSFVKRAARHSKVYMDNLKMAVEMYLMSAVHKNLFRVIATVMSSSDAELNKTTRNLAQLQLHDLGVREIFSQNIKPAKKELAKLNSYSTPLGRLLCIKRVTSLLSRSPSTASHSAAMMTTDDFLPLLIFLIIKSEIPNWNASLVYMSQFRFSKCHFEDEFGYYLASIEAALEHIISGEIREEISGKDKLQGFGWTPGQVDGAVVQRQTSGPSHTAVEDFFRYVQCGDEKAVEAMLQKPKKASEEIYLKLCHPLCSCEKCEKKQAESKTDYNLVTAYTRDNRGYTALHIAANFGQAMLIDLLVKHGAVVDATDYLGLTPLLLACQRGFQSVMLMLLHFGANVTATDNDGNTPLHLSAANGHEDCVKALVFHVSSSRRIDINCVNDIGDTALHFSAKWGYENIVKTLLDSGANPTIKNRKKQTPISVAQNINIQKLLVVASVEQFQLINIQVVPKPPADVKNLRKISSVQQLDDGIEGGTVVHVETVNLSADDVKVQKTKDKLFRVIRDGDIQLVKYYLGFDMEEDDEETESVNMISEDVCHPLCQCPKCVSVHETASRSSTGLTVNCTTSTFYTPLHLAVLHKHIDLVELFLQKGANVNARTHKNMTPLHLACCVRSAQSCIKLLECGAKVNIQDISGDTPLHICSANGFLTGVFSLIEHKALVNMLNKQGNTPLHESVQRGYTNIVQHLLHSGAHLDVINKKGQTPTQLAKDESVHALLESYSKDRESQQRMSRTFSDPVSVTSSGHVGIGELFSAFEDHDLEKLKQLTEAIRTFNRRDSLRRTDTQDSSGPHIGPLAHSLSIKHFDKSKLKHVNSFDKSGPMYMYSLSKRNEEDGGDDDDDRGDGDDDGDDNVGGGGGCHDVAGSEGAELKNVLDSEESSSEKSYEREKMDMNSGSVTGHSPTEGFTCDTDGLDVAKNENSVIEDTENREISSKMSKYEASEPEAGNSERHSETELSVDRSKTTSPESAFSSPNSLPVREDTRSTDKSVEEDECEPSETRTDIAERNPRNPTTEMSVGETSNDTALPVCTSVPHDCNSVPKNNESTEKTICEAKDTAPESDESSSERCSKTELSGSNKTVKTLLPTNASYTDGDSVPSRTECLDEEIHNEN